MGGVSFEVYQTGPEIAAAFAAARNAAAHEHGWREDSGTIATKDRVIAVETTPIPRADAQTRVDELLGQIDAPYCDHYDTVAAAIPITEDGTTVCGWLFFGIAND